MLVSWLSFFRDEVVVFPPSGYTLRWFRAILDQRNFVDGFVTSLEVGVFAMLAGLVLGVPASLCLTRYRFPGRGEPRPAALDCRSSFRASWRAPRSTSSRSRRRSSRGCPLVASLPGLVLAHVVITIPWTVRLVTASLMGFDRTVEEAAQNLGRRAVDDLPARHLAADPARASWPRRCSASSSRSATSR